MVHILFKGYETCTKTDHILDHKINLNKFKGIEIKQNIFSDQNGIKLEISSRKTTEKSPNTWKLNNTLLNNPQAKVEISKENLNHTEMDFKKPTTYQIYGIQPTVLREKHIH